VGVEAGELTAGAPALTVLISAILFGTMHLLRTGTSAAAVAVIAELDALYAWTRLASRSTATAAVAHSVYNFTLYLGMAA
jgi:membrane protease YdiL (CAAX protease family)